MRGICLPLFIACAGAPLSAQTIGMVEPPSGCQFEEVEPGARYECMYENEASNRVHLIFLEQVLTLGPGGARSLAENARHVTNQRIEALLASYADIYQGSEGSSSSVEDVTGGQSWALYCGEGGEVIRLTSTVDFDLRVRECAFAPSLPGMMPRDGVIDTILYHEFHPTDQPAETTRDDARRIFRSLALSLPPVPFEATAHDFLETCTRGDFGKTCARITDEVFEYGRWIAPYWPLQVSREAWLGCLDRLERATPAPWLDDFPGLTEHTSALPAQMVLFTDVLRICDGASDLATRAAGPIPARRQPAPQ